MPQRIETSAFHSLQLHDARFLVKPMCARAPSLIAPPKTRNRASKSSKGGSSGAEGKGGPLSCSVCKQDLPAASFTNTQARKPDASRKCRDCSAAAEAAEAEALRVARAAKMSEAQAASASASKLPKGAAGAAARLKGKFRLNTLPLSLSFSRGIIFCGPCSKWPF